MPMARLPAPETRAPSAARAKKSRRGKEFDIAEAEHLLAAPFAATPVRRIIRPPAARRDHQRNVKVSAAKRDPEQAEECQHQTQPVRHDAEMQIDQGNRRQQSEREAESGCSSRMPSRPDTWRAMRPSKRSDVPSATGCGQRPRRLPHGHVQSRGIRPQHPAEKQEHVLPGHWGQTKHAMRPAALARAAGRRSASRIAPPADCGGRGSITLSPARKCRILGKKVMVLSDHAKNFGSNEGEGIRAEVVLKCNGVFVIVKGPDGAAKLVCVCRART